MDLIYYDYGGSALASDMRKVELSAGRSINLALSARGWNALKVVGVDQDVEKMAIPMYKRVMHASSFAFYVYGIGYLRLQT